MEKCQLCLQQKPDVGIVGDGLMEYALCNSCCERLFDVLAERVARQYAEEEFPLD